jgi:hypothetical protein
MGGDLGFWDFSIQCAARHMDISDFVPLQDLGSVAASPVSPSSAYALSETPAKGGEGLVETCFSSLGRMVAFPGKRPWLGCCLEGSVLIECALSPTHSPNDPCGTLQDTCRLEFWAYYGQP